ncbi:Hypothetical protein HDN1F_34330 [gamma proteobacterium HdN1]|nr:Hypothetical protein HDN1F_34330 [gamma proteobacterium HdN1]
MRLKMPIFYSTTHSQKKQSAQASLVPVSLRSKSQKCSLILLGACIPSVALADLKPWLNVVSPEPQFSLDFGANYGVRSGEFRWHVGSAGSAPNILSELEYQGLEFSEYRLYARLSVNQGRLKHWQIDTQLSNASAERGTAIDSDYQQNHREGMYRRSTSDLGGSTSRSQNLSLGYRITPSSLVDWPVLQKFSESSQFTVIPSIGWVFSEQTLKMTQGTQTFATPERGEVLGRFTEALNSVYEASWNGAAFGMVGQIEGNQQTLRIGYQQIFARFRAVADWNLRTDFQHPRSFSHAANATASHLNLDYQWHVNERWAINLRWFHERWISNTGTDTVYLASGERVRSRLGEAGWRSTGYNLGMQMRF